jgi:hypothetical protein
MREVISTQRLYASGVTSAGAKREEKRDKERK